MASSRVFHYTSLESLALILKARTLRFTRLDRVDDVSEAQQLAGINFGQYFFVSCWTQETKESIPQWNMYSKEMQGSTGDPAGLGRHRVERRSTQSAEV
jgi:hypothetical protein